MNKDSILCKLLHNLSCHNADQFLTHNHLAGLDAKRERLRKYLEYLIELIDRFSARIGDSLTYYYQSICNTFTWLTGLDATTEAFRYAFTLFVTFLSNNK